MKSLLSLSALALLISAAPVKALIAETHDVSWIREDDNVWSNGLNWTDDWVPNNTEQDLFNVTIDSPYVVTLDMDATLTSLNLLDAVIATSGNYTIGAATTIQCFIVGGDGSLTLSGNSVFGSAEAVSSCIDVDDGATLINSGTFNHSSGYDEDNDSDYYADLMINGSGENETKFVNTGTYNASAANGVDLYVMGAGSDPSLSLFVNEGTLNKTGDAIFKIFEDVSFVNSGSVAVNAGRFEFGNDNGGTTGSFTVADGATLAMTSGSVTLKSGASISGEGLLDITSQSLVLENGSSIDIGGLALNTDGYLTVDAGAEVIASTFTIDGGSLDANGAVTVGDASLLSGGIYGSAVFTATGTVDIIDIAFGGAGQKVLSGTSTISGNNPDSRTSRLDIEAGTTVENSGAFFQNGSVYDNDGNIRFNTDGGEGNSTFLNTGSFTSDVEDGITIGFQGLGGDATTNSFTNEAIFIKKGSGTTFVGEAVTFNNTGSIEIQAGTLRIDSRIGGSGTILVKGGGLDLGLSTTGNKLQLAGGTISKRFAASSSITNGDLNVESAFETGVATTAQIRAGVIGNQEAAFDVSFKLTATESFQTNESRVSDIYSLEISEDALFVLELSLTSGSLDDAYLGFLNGDGLWVNAVDANDGNNASGGQLGFDGTFAAFQTEYETTLSDYIGAWGGSGTGVWAVVNHDGDFAAIGAIPEPGTWALLAAGGVGFLALRGRRSRVG